MSSLAPPVPAPAAVTSAGLFEHRQPFLSKTGRATNPLFHQISTGCANSSILIGRDRRRIRFERFDTLLGWRTLDVGGLPRF